MGTKARMGALLFAAGVSAMAIGCGAAPNSGPSSWMLTAGEGYSGAGGGGARGGGGGTDAGSDSVADTAGGGNAAAGNGYIDLGMRSPGGVPPGGGVPRSRPATGEAGAHFFSR